jgi:hypothetical protein
MKKILTMYNQVIDYNLVAYQSMVVNLFKGDAEFITIQHHYANHEFSHGNLLTKWTSTIFTETNCDCLLILDIDSIPLSREAVDLTFDMAYNGNLIGNIQRSNHIENGKHVYVAPSFFCISKSTYKELGRPGFEPNDEGDVAEQFTYNAEKLGIPYIFYMPRHSDSGYGPNDDFWPLADDMPKYGIGTTFEFQGIDMSYHLFESHTGIYNKLFYKKCHEIIMR